MTAKNKQFPTECTLLKCDFIILCKFEGQFDLDGQGHQFLNHKLMKTHFNIEDKFKVV